MNTEAIRALEARYEAEIADLRAQLESVGAGGVSGRLMGAVPGWKLVPVEPTQAMLEAGVKEQHGTAVYKSVARSGCSAYEGDQYANYAAMLSAAPMPPTAQPADLAPCPTCGETTPFTGTCGAAKNDKLALCRQQRAAQPAEPSDCIAELEVSDAVVERMSKILASIALTVNDPELPRHRHSYHDLAEKVAVLQLEVELYRSQATQPQQSTIAVQQSAAISITDSEVGTFERQYLIETMPTRKALELFLKRRALAATNPTGGTTP